jgi:hypothetical protein
VAEDEAHVAIGGIEVTAPLQVSADVNAHVGPG